MRTTTIECPECAGHGGEGVYCDECLSTGQLTVTGAVAEAIDILRADLAAATQRAEAAEAELATLRRYADDADKSSFERIARIDELEATLAAERQRAEAAEAQRDEYAQHIRSLRETVTLAREEFAEAKQRAEQWKARWEHDSTDAYNARINEAARHLAQQAEAQP